MRLRHPNVIKLLELVENEHDCYLIFPFYGCGSLADLLKRRGGTNIKIC
jgi:serine/threonine protein kinase